MFGLMEWAGFRSKLEVWGDPQPLADVWWHVPLYAALFFLFGVFFPWRQEFKKKGGPEGPPLRSLMVADYRLATEA
jgi:hypothetical protein